MDGSKDEFRDAARQPSRGLLGEVVGFLRENRKWWLIPILLVMAAFGVLFALSTTGAAPFIYTLF